MAPAELEDVLLSHPKISDAAVAGVPDEKQGEAPKAFIVKRDDKLSEREVMDYMAIKVSVLRYKIMKCRLFYLMSWCTCMCIQLAPHKQLAGGVKFVDAVPKSASGKILRRLLKDM